MKEKIIMSDLREELAPTLLVTTSDYETERGKPMPSINHSVIQANLIVALRLHYGKKYTIGKGYCKHHHR